MSFDRLFSPLHFNYGAYLAAKQHYFRSTMRPASPAKLQNVVKDFLNDIAVLPNWITSSALDRPDPGHYEWGNWSDSMRSKHLWMLGGPWRTMAANVKKDKLITSISNFHKLKDQLVWEIVEQTYCRAEAVRQSPATEETVKTRIRSVFSWQRRHDTKKHSLIWFVDFAFTFLAFSEFQGLIACSNLPISNLELEGIVPDLSPAQFGTRIAWMENQMFQHYFLPFYYKEPRLTKNEILLAHHIGKRFCLGLKPPMVGMDVGVRETRGMPREEKAIDFMTPWLQSIDEKEHDERWNIILGTVVEHEPNISDWGMFKAELCRSIISSILCNISLSDKAEAGYVSDIRAATAVEQSEPELLVPLRSQGQKRKKTISRSTFRNCLECRLQKKLSSSSPVLSCSKVSVRPSVD